MFYIGCIGDDIDPNSATEDFPWETYWRSIFRKITDDDIREYELKYKGSIYLSLIYNIIYLHNMFNINLFVLGSDDEIRDLKKGYLAGKGDMESIINMVPFSSVYEEDRLRAILEKIIEEEDLPRYEAFTNEPPSKKKKRLAKVSIRYTVIFFHLRPPHYFYIPTYL